jgi:molybdate transport system substrate-binding protein
MIRLLVAAAVLFSMQVGRGEAAEVRALVTIAMQSVVEELAPQFERISGHKLNVTYGLSPILAKRIADGEAADFLISTRAGIDSLLKSGKVGTGDDTELARSFIGVAVRKGEAHPDISTPEALKRTLLAARAISYSNPAAGGPSGVHFAKVLERLGVVEEMKAKTKFPPTGGFVAKLLIDKDVDIAVQQYAELITLPGTEIVGPLPGDLQNVTIYVAAIPANAKKESGAKALVAFLRSPEAVSVMKSKGLEPR